MTTQTTEKVNEARDVALSQSSELEFLEQFSRATSWEEVDEGFIFLHGLDTDEDVSDMLGEWFNSNAYDIRGTYSFNPKSLVEVEMLTAGGGPTIWVSYNGNEDGTMTIKATWGADKWETWATAPNVAAYLWELVEAYE